MMLPEVRALFPDVVRGVDSSTLAAPLALFEEEEQAISRAVDKRKREFALGRSCARKALEGLGVLPIALVPNADRTVCWPSGVHGSITHADGYVAAVVSKQCDLRGVGIDAELKDRVHERLWKQIANEREEAFFRAASNETQRLERAALLFSAKEAFYKAQYTISRAWVGFHDVIFETSGQHFTITLLKDIERLSACGTVYEGRFVLNERHVITACVIT